MISYCRFRILAFLLLSALTVSNSASAQTPIGVESIVPRYSHANLSPDGRYLAIATPKDGGDSVSVIDLENPGSGSVAYPIERAIVEGLLWRGNDALIIRVYGRFSIYPIALDIAYLAYPKSGEPPMQITFRANADFRQSIYGTTVSFSGLSDVADLMPDTETHFYMAALNLRPPGGYNLFGGTTADIWARDLLRVDAETSVATISTMVNEYTAQWYLDGNGNILARVDVLPGGSQVVRIPAGGDRFLDLATVGASLTEGGQFVGLSQDASALVIRSLRSGEPGLYPVDLATGAVGAALYSGRNYLEEIVDKSNFRVIGAKYADGLLTRSHYFDAALSPIQSTLDGALANHSIEILATSEDRQKVLFEAHAPARPPVLGIYDATTPSITTIAEMHPEIVSVPLGEVRGHPYNDSNGSPMGGMLALPPGIEASNLPTVILDDTRTDLEFDLLGQFLTSRGYAVLRPGVRQVQSFGELSTPGALETWVTNFQSSVLGGLDNLVAAGITDPGRVCIIGTGENGYAALMTVVNAADKFQCAVGVNGMYDLQRAVDQARRVGATAVNSFYSALARNADQFTEADLERFSPINFAGAIDASVLIVGTDRDGENTDMIRSLERADKEVVYAELVDNIENPAADRFANMQIEYAAIGDFLSEQIGQ